LSPINKFSIKILTQLYLLNRDGSMIQIKMS